MGTSILTNNFSTLFKVSKGKFFKQTQFNYYHLRHKRIRFESTIKVAQHNAKICDSLFDK